MTRPAVLVAVAPPAFEAVRTALEDDFELVRVSTIGEALELLAHGAARQACDALGADDFT